MNQEWQSSMRKKLNNLHGNAQRYFATLFDPVQTHGLYGISKDEVDTFKKKLKELGANRFRVVKASGDFRILCFKANKIPV